MIEDLREGNVLWSPAQLSSMTTQTFKDSVSILGEIRNYSAEHLTVLREKATQVHTHTLLIQRLKSQHSCTVYFESLSLYAMYNNKIKEIFE